MEHIINYKPKYFSELLNVSVKTLQRWDRDGILKAFRTPTGRRYYTHNQYLEYISVSKNTISFQYDFEEQKIKLKEYAISINCKEVEKIDKNLQNGDKSNRTTKTED